MFSLATFSKPYPYCFTWTTTWHSNNNKKVKIKKPRRLVLWKVLQERYSQFHARANCRNCLVTLKRWAPFQEQSYIVQKQQCLKKIRSAPAAYAEHLRGHTPLCDQVADAGRKGSLKPQPRRTRTMRCTTLELGSLQFFNEDTCRHTALVVVQVH